MDAPKRCDNNGFASGLEAKNDEVLRKSGVVYYYEEGPCVLDYKLPVRKGKCDNCGSEEIFTDHKYTADFVIESKSNDYIHIECKGSPWAWTSKVRSKHVAIKKQYPNMDLRFVFSNIHSRISKKSKTTNEDWCKRYGFKCADKLIPEEWINE